MLINCRGYCKSTGEAVKDLLSLKTNARVTLSFNICFSAFSGYWICSTIRNRDKNNKIEQIKPTSLTNYKLKEFCLNSGEGRNRSNLLHSPVGDLFLLWEAVSSECEPEIWKSFREKCFYHLVMRIFIVFNEFYSELFCFWHIFVCFQLLQDDWHHNKGFRCCWTFGSVSILYLYSPISRFAQRSESLHYGLTVDGDSLTKTFHFKRQIFELTAMQCRTYKLTNPCSHIVILLAFFARLQIKLNSHSICFYPSFHQI